MGTPMGAPMHLFSTHRFLNVTLVSERFSLGSGPRLTETACPSPFLLGDPAPANARTDQPAILLATPRSLEPYAGDFFLPSDALGPL